MIIDRVIGFILDLTARIISLAPSFTPPSFVTEVLDDLESVGNALGTLNRWIDVGFWATGLLLIGVLHLAFMTVWCVLWIKARLPGGG